mgnify:CR=1 FL=1
MSTRANGTEPPPGLPAHPTSNLKWIVLGAGVVSQASMSSLHHGLPSIGPLRRSDFGLSLAQTGLVLAASNIGTMSTMILSGMATDRFGERVVSGVGLGLAGVLMILSSLASSIVTVGILLFLAGGLSAVTISASGRSVMGWFSRRERGLALGIRQMSVTLGGALAAIALPLAATQWGVRGAFVTLGLFFLFGAVVAFFGLLPPPHKAGARASGLPAPLRDRPLWRLAVCAGLLGCAQTAIGSFTAIFLTDQRGFTLTAAAAAFAAIQIGGGVARVAAGRLSDRTGERVPQMRLHGFILALLLVATALLVDGPTLPLVAALLLAGIFTLSWNGLAFTAAAELAGYARAGQALGLQGTIMRVVSVGAGVGFGLAVTAFSWPVAFVLLALFPLAAALLLTPLIAEERRRAAAADAPSRGTPE